MSTDKNTKQPQASPSCSFCEKNQRDVRKLIAGPKAYICDECIKLCHEIIADDAEAPSELAAPPRRLMSSSAEAILAALGERVVGHADAKRTLSFVGVAHMQRAESAGASSPRKVNLIVAGPTGTGKTAAAQCLASSIGAPFASIDATRLSGSRYFKEENLFSHLLQTAGNRERAERGIVCVKHLDQLCTHGPNDAEGRRIQGSLLSVLDGAEAIARSGKDIMLATHEILFIGTGAFTGIESIIQRRLSRAGTVSPPERCFVQLTKEDLITYGLLPEFVERFALLTVFDYLSPLEMVEILTRPATGLIAEYTELFAQEGTQVSFGPSAVDAIAAEAARRKGGVRSLRSILEAIALEFSFRLRHRPGSGEMFTIEAADLRGIIG